MVRTIQYCPKQIVLGLKNDDPKVTAYYYRYLWDRSMRFLNARYGANQPEQLEDFFSDAFIVLRQKIQNGSYNHQNLHAYALGIVKNMFFQMRKNQSRKTFLPLEQLPDMEIPPKAFKSLGELLDSLFQFELKSWYNKLHKKEQQLLDLRMAGLSYKEIAEEMDLAYGTVRNHFSDLLKDAKEILKPVDN